MAVRYRADRACWQAQVTLETGRISKHFQTEPEAVQWEAEQLSRLCEKRQVERQVESAPVAGSLGELVRICARLDWEGKDPSQLENAARLVRMLGRNAHAAELTMRRLDDLVVDLRANGLSNTTIKKYLSAASVMLKRACRLGYIDTVPLFPEKRTLKSPEPRDLVIQSPWFDTMLETMERREQRISTGLTVFLRRMGCRVGEALDLTWDRVDLNNGEVQFVKTKGAMPRRLPVESQVASVVRSMKARGKDRVFPISYWTFLSHYSDAKHAACDALGLGPVVRDEWVIHTLRHTRLTELAQEGWPAPAIQQWAGHRSLSVTQRYIHGSSINLKELMQC